MITRVRMEARHRLKRAMNPAKRSPTTATAEATICKCQSTFRVKWTARRTPSLCRSVRWTWPVIGMVRWRGEAALRCATLTRMRLDSTRSERRSCARCRVDVTGALMALTPAQSSDTQVQELVAVKKQWNDSSINQLHIY